MDMLRAGYSAAFSLGMTGLLLQRSNSFIFPQRKLSIALLYSTLGLPPVNQSYAENTGALRVDGHSSVIV